MQELTTIQKILLLWLALQPTGLILAPPCMPMTLIIRLRPPQNQKVHRSLLTPFWSYIYTNVAQLLFPGVQRHILENFLSTSKRLGIVRKSIALIFREKDAEIFRLFLFIVQFSIRQKITEFLLGGSKQKQRTTHESSVHGFSPYHTAVDNWHTTQW